MSPPPSPPPPAALVFTDLDGSLLDHDSYSCGPARAALDRLAALGIAWVPTTSKTDAECQLLEPEIGPCAARIVENGCGVTIVADSALFDGRGMCADGGLLRQALGLDHAALMRQVNGDAALREFRWRGFSEMSVDDIVVATGLTPAAAAAAARREYCEPVQWMDETERLDDFLARLRASGLQAVRGGRFVHLMDARVDKARAMRWLCGRWRGGEPPLTIALGDADNDRGMLNAADIAVLVRSPHHDYPAAQGRRRTIRTRGFGPAGWAEAIHQILDELIKS